MTGANEGVPTTDDPRGGAGADEVDADEARPLGRSLLRSAFYSVSSLVIVVAGFAVPLPVVETQPGAPTDIAPLVQIEGADVTELTGSSSLLTIRQREQGLLPALAILLDRDRTLHRVEEVFPAGIDRDDYHAAQRERFRRQFEIAAAVGAREAGVEVELQTAVVVANVVTDGPAAGLLFPGDVILTVDGEPLTDAESLQAVTREGEAGQELELEVVRQGEERTVTAALGTIPGEDGARLGVVIEDGLERMELPFDVTLSDGTRIGGPSAGLMVALTVYDLLSDEDLLQGRKVVGTGTLGSDGTVGQVGGVPEKMRAAGDHGADLALVPRSQLEDAQAAAPDGLTVIGVRTLGEALEALRRGPA